MEGHAETLSTDTVNISLSVILCDSLCHLDSIALSMTARASQLAWCSANTTLDIVQMPAMAAF